MCMIFCLPSCCVAFLCLISMTTTWQQEIARLDTAIDGINAAIDGIQKDIKSIKDALLSGDYMFCRMSEGCFT